MWVSVTVFYNVFIIKELEKVLPQTLVNLTYHRTIQEVRNRLFPKQLYYKDLQSQWFRTSPNGLVKASQDEKRPE